MRVTRALVCLTMLAGLPASAQTPLTDIRSNGSSQPTQTPIPGGEQYTLGEDQGTRPGAGVNLLQSLRTFTLGSGDRALFTADRALSTSNIIAHVEGGGVSQIYGQIASDIDGVRLFILNPAGFFFGPGSSLDLSGSFHAVTANSLLMTDENGIERRAASADPALRFAQPKAFGFEAVPTGTIRVEGTTLSLTPDLPGATPHRTLSLVGAGVSIVDSTLEAYSGRLDIASVRSIGEVIPSSFDAELGDRSLDPLDVGGFETLGDVAIHGSTLRVGSALLADSPVPRFGRTGVQVVRARDLRLDGARLDATSRFDDSTALDLGIDVALTGDLHASGGSSIRGGLGDVSIRGRELRLADGSVETSTSAGGAPGRVAGDVSLEALGSIALDRSRVGSFAAPFVANSAAGEVRLDAPAIEADASEIAVESGAAPAGNVVIEGGQLTLRGASRIRTDPAGETSGASYGDVLLRTTDGISILEGSSVESGVIAQAGAGGDPGRIEVDTGLLLLDRGAIDVSFEPLVHGSGQIDIGARAIVVQNGSLVAGDAAIRSGDDNLSLEASESIAITSGSELRSQASRDQGGGIVELLAPEVLVDAARVTSTTATDPLTLALGPPSGSLLIEGRHLRVTNGGVLETSTRAGGPAGSITVAMSDSVAVTGPGSGILSESDPLQGAIAGAGGSISIQTSRFVADRGARVSSSISEQATFSGLRFSGPAGDVSIKSDAARIGSGVEISSRSAVALPGPVPFASDALAFPGAGNVRVEVAGSLVATNASISSSALLGAGGRVTLEAGRTILDGTAVSTSVSGGQPAGDVELRGGPAVLTGGATLESTSDAALLPLFDAGPAGDAGDISVETAELRLIGSSLSTEASRSLGGNIDVHTARNLHVQRGRIETSVASGVGAGGDIQISGAQVTLNGAEIRANADAGNGGNIRLRANQILTSTDTAISASSNTGIDGTIQLDAPEVNLESGLASLQTAFLDASKLVRPSCEVAAASAPGGRFVIAQRRGLPSSPEELLVAFDAHGGGAELAEVGPAPLPEVAAGGGPRVRSAREGLRDAAAQQQRGDYADSVETLRGSLALAEQAGDEARVASVLGSLGNTYIAMGDARAAEDHLTRGIAIAKGSGRAELAANILNDLGNHHAAELAHGEALAAYEQAAALAIEAGDPAVEARAVANAARAALEAGRVEHARALLAQLRPSLEQLPNELAVATSIHLAKTHAGVAARQPAVRAESLLEAHTLLMAAVQRANDAGDDRSLAYALGNLGGLYQEEGHFDEALPLTRMAVRAAERAEAFDSLYRWHWQEGRILWALGRPAPAIQSYRQAVAILEETRQEALARYGSAAVHFRQRVAPVYLDLVSALLETSSAEGERGRLHEARSTVELLKAAELRDYFRNESVAELEAKATSLDAVSGDAAVIYPIVLEDRVELLVSRAGNVRRHVMRVPRRELEPVVRRFRLALQDPSSDAYREPSRRLYDWLIRPFAADLEGVRTLVFVPDGPLRTIPMGALHDGHKFLIERYALAITPGLSLIDPHPLDTGRARLLAAGVSDGVQGFSPLAKVPDELAAVQELFGGEVLLNRDFRVARVEEEMKGSQPTVVHIASHGVFTGDPETSFLLAHDERLTMERLSDVIGVTRFREQPLELLMLSACETAAGDDRAALGLAGVAIRAGARSAVGSLWSIADEAAYEVVTDFYRRLKQEQLSRAEALQLAQRRLLADPRMSHPFYWSPFLLISNWL